MKKYRTKYNDEIQSFEVVKETEKQIVYVTKSGREDREAKESTWHSWHETFADAKAYLYDKCASKVKLHKDMAEHAEKQLERISKIQEII